jgi:hypothetical protein
MQIHMQRSSVHSHHVLQRHGGWNEKSQIWTLIPKDTFPPCWCPLLMFLGPSKSFILVSFSSGFFAAIWPWMPDSSEQLMLRWVCYLNSEAFLFGLQFEAVNSNWLILCCRGNSGSSFPMMLMLRCVCYLNSVKHSFGLQFLRLVTNELILQRGNSGSSVTVAVLMRASFIIVLDGF